MSSSTGQPLSHDPFSTTPPATGSSAADPFATDPLATGASPARGGGSSGSGASGTAGAAKQEAAGVASDAADAGQRVAGVAEEQASDVLGEAGRQARDLLGQTRAQLSEQSSAGQRRAASGLGSLAGELKDLAEGKGGDGLVTDLAHRSSQQLEGAASWLGDREPTDVLREVHAFARRRPVAFLALAAGAGLVAGRLTRGAAAAAHGGGQEAGGAAHRTTASAPPVADATGADRGAEWAGTPEPVFDVDAAVQGPAVPATPSGSARPSRGPLAGPGERAYDGPVR